MYYIILVTIVAVIAILSIILGKIYKKRKVFLTGILIFLILSVFVFLGTIYYIEAEEENLSNQSGEYKDVKLQVPDRIIYKKGRSQYYIITSENDKFSLIYSDIYDNVKSVKDGKVLTEEEINKIKDEGSFIEFDYNLNSKNYIFPLDEKDIGMIRMFTDSGQIQLNYLKDKDKIRWKLNSVVRDLKSYTFEKNRSYTSENIIKEIPDNIDIKEKTAGVYQTIVTTEARYNEIVQILGFKDAPKLTSTDFPEQKVIITISNHDIDSITENVGNIKYKFKNKIDGYKVNILIASPVTNVNCIYCEVEYDENEFKTEITETTDDTNSTEISYPLEVQGIITNISGNKIEVGYDSEVTSSIIYLKDGAIIKEYNNPNQLTITDLKIGDSIYAIGDEIDGNTVKEIEVEEINIYKKENIKKQVEYYIKDGYRRDGHGIVDKYINEDGTGIIIVALNLGNFIYPIRLKVDKNTETYLGMGYHLQSNYGYVLNEMCDITLDTKILDIDDIRGTVKMIEYIAD